MTSTPAGFSPFKTDRIVPSLPPASIAWSTTNNAESRGGEEPPLEFVDGVHLLEELDLGGLLVPPELLARIMVTEVERGIGAASFDNVLRHPATVPPAASLVGDRNAVDGGWPTDPM